MAKYKKEEIIKAKVIGLQNYGAFVEVDDEYQGLIHISEISYGYVKNINDYVKIGDKIYTEVIKVDENNNPVLGINKKAIKVLQGQYNNLNKYYDSLTNDNEKLDLEKDLNEIKEKIEYLQTTPVEVYENKHLPKEEIRSRVEKVAQILQIWYGYFMKKYWPSSGCRV